MDRVTLGYTLRQPENPRYVCEYWEGPCSAGSHFRHSIGSLDRQRSVLKTKAGVPGAFADHPGDDLQCLGQVGAGNLKLIKRWLHHAGKAPPQAFEPLAQTIRPHFGAYKSMKTNALPGLFCAVLRQRRPITAHKSIPLETIGHPSSIR
jgi:hypothetical protein